MVEKLYVQRLSKRMFNVQSHFTPPAQCKTAGHVTVHARRGQAFEANGVEHSQRQQGQQQPPVDRQQGRRDGEVQCPQCAQHDADGQQDREPDQQQARGFHRRGAGT